MWAIARIEIGSLLTKDVNGTPIMRLPARAPTSGNYCTRNLGAYGGIMACAREFGDPDFADAVQRGRDEYGGDSIGTRRYLKWSNGANVAVAVGMLPGQDDYLRAVTVGASKAAL